MLFVLSFPLKLLPRRLRYFELGSIPIGLIFFTCVFHGEKRWQNIISPFKFDEEKEPLWYLYKMVTRVKIILINISTWILLIDTDCVPYTTHFYLQMPYIDQITDFLFTLAQLYLSYYLVYVSWGPPQASQSWWVISEENTGVPKIKHYINIYCPLFFLFFNDFINICFHKCGFFLSNFGFS